MSYLSNLFFSVMISLTTTITLASTTTETTQLQKIRIGWQVPWAVQGQIVQILKHTDILKKNGLTAEFIGKTFGPELNEIALAGSVDLILTADQPAVTLFSKNKGWLGIGRLMYNRTATYVPLNSKILKLEDLKGKTIGLPMGAAAERITVDALKNIHLSAPKDVTILNLDIREQGPLIMKNKTSEKWDNFDALSGFDPAPALFESQKRARIIHVGKVVSLVVMQENFIKEHVDVDQHFLNALKDAYEYYQKNTPQVNQWFLEEAHIENADQTVCEIAASLEPNLKVKDKKDIRISFNSDDLLILQSAADFVETKIKKHVIIKDFIKNYAQ